MPPLPQEREGEKGLSPSVARTGKVGRNATPRGGTREESRTRNQNSELRPKAALETEGGRRQEEKAGREGGTEQVAGQSRPASRPPRSLNTEGESCAHPARLRESRKAAAKDSANEGGRGRDRL